MCVCVRAGLSARQPDFECLLAAVVRRGEARYSNFVSQFEYTLCTYQMRAQMRRLVNRICFLSQPFSARAARKGGGGKQQAQPAARIQCSTFQHAA